MSTDEEESISPNGFTFDGPLNEAVLTPPAEAAKWL
jgi:hypothetical protein